MADYEGVFSLCVLSAACQGPHFRPPGAVILARSCTEEQALKPLAEHPTVDSGTTLHLELLVHSVWTVLPRHVIQSE